MAPSRDAKRARLEQLFQARNADKRFRDDSYEIEGSGNTPVGWDFRLASLLHLAP
jgi:hypothetical protein